MNDVAIIGGGIAGLTLAIQLLRTDSSLKVFVCDKQSYPYPETHKLGEALIEGGSFYLREIIGVGDHLKEHHVDKAGLRFYLPRDEAPKLEDKPEIGTDTELPLTTYVIARAKLENHLVKVARELGATISHETEVSSFEKKDDVYHLSIGTNGTAKVIETKWLIDATGRRAMLRKKQDLTLDSQHQVGSSFFKINKTVNPHTWSDDEQWRERCPIDRRRNATNHFLGEGFWIWLIPIRDNATSIGIVADTTIVNHDDISDLDRTFEWIDKNLPALGAQIRDDKDKVAKFGSMKSVSYSTKQVFSPDRWCLTGEAAAFTDPLYSTGLELVAIGNSMITNIVMCDRMGGDFAPVAGFMNDGYLLFYDVMMGYVRGMYSTFGKARVFSTKTAWDFTMYVSLPLGLFRYGKLFDPAFMQAFGPILGRTAELNQKMQALFRDWSTKEGKETPLFSPCHAKLEQVGRLETMYRDEVPADDAMMPLFTDNVAVLEETAIEIFNRITERLGIKPDKPATNPYAISLNADRWEEDGLFAGTEVNIRDSVRRDVSLFWAG